MNQTSEALFVIAAILMVGVIALTGKHTKNWSKSDWVMPFIPVVGTLYVMRAVWRQGRNGQAIRAVPTPPPVDMDQFREASERELTGDRNSKTARLIRKLFLGLAALETVIGLVWLFFDYFAAGICLLLTLGSLWAWYRLARGK